MMRSQTTTGLSARVKPPIIVTLIVFLVLPAGALAHPYHDEYVNKLGRGVTERVSLSSSGVEGNGDSGRTDCGEPDHYNYQASDNGRFVAFTSRAGNLHPGDTNGQVLQDVFVYDRKSKKIDLVSAMPNGLAPEVPAALDLDLFPCAAASLYPVISGNGRYVAFKSNLPLTGLREDAAGFHYNVFVRDLKRKRTELISRTWNGQPPVGLPTPSSGFFGLSISDDGRYVSFDSNVKNLIEDDPCASGQVLPSVDSLGEVDCSHVYVRDRRRNRTILVSRSSEGEPGNRRSLNSFVSGNGRFVAYESDATNIVDLGRSECISLCTNVFVHDLRTVATRIASVSRDGGTPNAYSSIQDISDNGRFVLYSSYGSDHVPTNFVDTYLFRCGGTYLRDLREERTERVSVTSTGSMLRGWGGSISGDGRYVAFHPDHNGTFCHPGGPHSYWGGKLIDRHTGQVDWRSFVRAAGTEEEAPPGTAFDVAGFSTMTIGGNGRFVVGPSDATNMVGGDRNGAVDMFVRELGNYPLGAGPLGGSPEEAEPPDDEICIVPALCVPAQGAVSWRAGGGADAVPLRDKSAKLHGASLAYRPELGNLKVAIELEHLGPGLMIGPNGFAAGGEPSLVYGLRFEVAGKNYEARASSLMGGTFGLFDCMDSAPLCTQVSTLEGGYGTTGERVVFSLPLKKIGLDRGGKLKDVVAFTGLGTYGTGASKILDRIALK